MENEKRAVFATGCFIKESYGPAGDNYCKFPLALCIFVVFSPIKLFVNEISLEFFYYLLHTVEILIIA